MADALYASDLEQNFPRLLPQIIQLWGYPELEGHLDHLLLDDRGDRQGFPEGIISDLIFLKLVNATRIHSEKHPNDKNMWDEPQIVVTVGHSGAS